MKSPTKSRPVGEVGSHGGSGAAGPALCEPCEPKADGEPGPIIIELAGEPKGKGRPRFTRAGIAYTPAKTRSYEGMLRLAAQVEMRSRPPLEGPLLLYVQAYVPIPGSWSSKRQRLAAAGSILPTTRPDFDNYLKTLDALNGVVWRDDAQIVEQRFAKRYSERPRLHIVVSRIVAAAAMAEAA